MVTPLDLAFLALGLGAAALSVALLVGVWQGRRPRAAGSSGGPATPVVEVGMRDLAEERDRRMLAVREDALGPDHPEVAAALSPTAIRWTWRPDFMSAWLMCRRSARPQNG